LYAILDIETTGGQFNEEGITEIAIYRHDGHEVTDQFISLVNPEIPIQPFVVKLTGINNSMLRTAPKFHEVARRIVEITDGCILVAHNASSDYRILRNEFRRLGYDFQSQILCTVELAQQLIPDQPSYSLGKLVRGLGIPIADRHRASGDAIATMKLFQLLLSKDIEKSIVRQHIRTEVEKGIEPKLLDLIDSVPSRTGIYYMYDQSGKLLFIGRSRNMKKNLTQHFTGSARISKKLQADTFTVTFEETGSELIAILKETQEIKANQPVYNRQKTRRNPVPWGLFSVDKGGYNAFEFRKTDGQETPLVAFISLQDGKNTLGKATSILGLCRKLNDLDPDGAVPCSAYRHEKCRGACIGEEDVESYNTRVAKFLDRIDTEGNLIITDRGRTVSEKSAVVIENGYFKGYAFYDLNHQIKNLAVLKNILVPMQGSHENRHAIRSYLAKHQSPKIVRL